MQIITWKYIVFHFDMENSDWLMKPFRTWITQKSIKYKAVTIIITQYPQISHSTSISWMAPKNHEFNLLKHWKVQKVYIVFDQKCSRHVDLVQGKYFPIENKFEAKNME